MILIIFARRNKDKAKLGNSAFPRSSSRHNEKGKPAGSGELVITNPWPAMFREPERFAKQYWRSVPKWLNLLYRDRARKDKDVYY